MKMKSILGAALFAATMAFSSGASAINIDGITFDAGITFKATRIFENVIVDPGDVLDGIGRVNSIENGGGVETWANGDNGRELTFRFDNYVVESIVILSPTEAQVFFSGGNVNFYSDSNLNFTSSDPGGQAQDIANATDGNLWLTTVGAPTGIVCGGGGAGDPAAGSCFSGDGTEITLSSNISIVDGDLATVSSGDGNGFLDVANAGGLADANFDTNQQPSGQDINLGSNFSAPPDGSTINWGLDGTADLDAFSVPEPGTLGLLGLGLLGLGLAARSWRRNAS